MTTKEQDREMKIFIIHNNETERLNYLIPQAEALAKAFQSTGESCVLELVGPEEREREKNLVPDTLANRLRRARDAARLYATAERGAPEPNGPLRKGTIATRKFLETILAYNRPITIEQDVLRGHAECWKRAAESDGPAIILESDAVFREDSIDKLIHLSAWLLVRRSIGNLSTLIWREVVTDIKS